MLASSALASSALASAFVVCVLTASASASEPGLPAAALERVVLDAGHGGSDPGCLGAAGYQEKALTLKFTLRLRALVEQRMTGVEVLLTRDDDRTVGLSERTHLANLNAADVLVSLHFNCAENRAATGVETFYLSPTGTQPGELVPGFEESGPAAPQPGEASVVGDRTALIVEDLRRAGATLWSARLAESIQSRLVRATGLVDRGVRQAQFRVLRGAHMPAVVVELGFLSNAGEGQRLMTNALLDRLAIGVVEGLETYDTWLAAARASGQ